MSNSRRNTRVEDRRAVAEGLFDLAEDRRLDHEQEIRDLREYKEMCYVVEHWDIDHDWHRNEPEEDLDPDPCYDDFYYEGSYHDPLWV